MLHGFTFSRINSPASVPFLRSLEFKNPARCELGRRWKGRLDFVSNYQQGIRRFDPAVELKDSDFELGGLRLVSYARPSKMFIASGGIFLSLAGQLGTEKISEILQRVVGLFVFPNSR